MRCYPAPHAAAPTQPPLMTDMDAVIRCPWGVGDPLNRAYHDLEWGVPLHDERRLFELLNLEGAQAGLAWITILRKRDGYRRAFEDWDPKRIAGYGPDDEARLLADPGIVRNRAKIRATIANAGAYLRLTDELGSLDDYLWSFVDGRPIQNQFVTMDEMSAETELSRALSRDLRKRGFSFIGPTIVYAFMQAAGLANDHLVSCFRHAEVSRLG
jgi:DNA-3-methyladenine glycosylase I